MGLADDLRTGWENQFDDEPGGGLFDPGEGTYELDEATQGDVGPDNPFDGTVIDNQFDDDPGGGFTDGDTYREAASEARDIAFNIGPDWLDEAALIVLPLILVGAVLWLARPLLTVLAGVSE